VILLNVKQFFLRNTLASVKLLTNPTNYRLEISARYLYKFSYYLLRKYLHTNRNTHVHLSVYTKHILLIYFKFVIVNL
jgi:hypothetical protein